VRRLGVLIGLLAALACAPAARASINTVFNDGETPEACAAKAGGIRVCQGVTETFDGVTNIDVNVIFPPASQGDGPFPVIGWFHGWGFTKLGVDRDGNATDRAKDWAQRGYAVFSMSDRGWGNSCGGLDPQRLTDPAGCADGYAHLMDTRVEVRDAQYLFGELADEGRILPDKIGVVGGSYGGGISMALAALRNRVMMPDDSLVPWVSDDGKPMEIAVATPEYLWTDLAYALMPNGRNLDYVVDNTYFGPNGDYPIGVMKQSFDAALYATGQYASNYAPPGQDPDADLISWYAAINAGEPYDGSPLMDGVVEEITAHHSSYYIPRNGTAPAPLLMANGWADDIFPVDEAIRFYNRTRSEFPDSPISLFFLDFGHQRAQSKDADVAALHSVEQDWFDYYLKGIGPEPEHGATAITQTCPKDAPSGGPFTAPTWDELSPGEVRFTDDSTKTISPAAGDPSIGTAFDPVADEEGPKLRGCATASGADQTGAATYRLPEVKGDGYTLLGSPTIIADIESSSATSQIAARLLDVAPDGNETLVARRLYRPDADGRQVFQLTANGWKFEEGHVAKLELLPQDAPYGRPSNGQGPITVSNLDLRLPVREKVADPVPVEVPPGETPVPGTDVAGPCESGFSERGTKRNDRLQGTAGGDRLRGRKGNDRIAGKDGDDCLSGGRGKDRVFGGNGDDKVKVRDGERDRVDCGKGKKDRVTADRMDKLRGCEEKKRR
jgi:predicted acyl esterase